MDQRFNGSQEYVASDALMMAVNAAITLEKPLLIKGEPGTGKTMLAEQVAAALDAPFYQWHVKSTTKAQQGLYEYDAVSRLRDSQLGDDRVHDISNYIVKGKLWQAFEGEKRAVLLIDEIDKADVEFPNDLLQELDKMEFYVHELSQTIAAKQRPIVIITSNNEKELPDPFLQTLHQLIKTASSLNRCLLLIAQVFFGFAPQPIFRYLPRQRNADSNRGCSLSKLEKGIVGRGVEKFLHCA